MYISIYQSLYLSISSVFISLCMSIARAIILAHHLTMTFLKSPTSKKMLKKTTYEHLIQKAKGDLLLKGRPLS